MAFALLYSIRDAKNETSTMEVNIPESFNIGVVVEFAGDLALLINEIITGAITRIGIAFIMNLPGGLRVTPLANSDVEEGARFQFLTSGGFNTSMRVPTFLETLIASDSRQVDTADTDVAAFVTAITAGIAETGPTTVTPADKRDEDIVSLVSALEQFMSSRG